MNPAIARRLRCPLCLRPFEQDPTGAGVTCAGGHRFDAARQGYLNLLVGRAPAGADTAEMVAARAELLGAGHFDHLAKALRETAATLTGATAATPTGTAASALAGAAASALAGATASALAGPGLVLDAGAGTGFYLGAVLDGLPDHLGLAVDVSKAAARRAARAHPRAGAVVCDVWRGLPVEDGCADVLLDVFAPRNPAEFHRVLRPDGVLLVVTPRPDHLTELVRSVGLIGVDPDKDERLERAFTDSFRLIHEVPYVDRLAVSQAMAARFVRMGPNAWHTDAARLADRLAALGDPVTVTSSVTLRAYRPASRGASGPA